MALVAIFNADDADDYDREVSAYAESPSLTIKTASCLMFTYKVVTELEVLAHYGGKEKELLKIDGAYGSMMRHAYLALEPGKAKIVFKVTYKPPLDSVYGALIDNVTVVEKPCIESREFILVNQYIV